MSEVFFSRLKSARGNLSQQAAADKIGIKQSAYARYESGKSTPGVELLTRICIELKVSADWLLGLTNNEPREARAEQKLEGLKKAIVELLKEY